MDDRLRTSDADRDRAAARLQDHFVEGRLTREELDERITAALNARTHGDLRRVLADLPEPAPVWPQGRPSPWQPSPWRTAPLPVIIRRGPRLLPLAVVALIAALLIPGGGWLFIGVLKAIMLLWLVGCVVAIIAAFRFRRLARSHARSHYRHRGWPGPHHHWHGRS